MIVVVPNGTAVCPPQDHLARLHRRLPTLRGDDVVLYAFGRWCLVISQRARSARDHILSG